MVSTLDSVRAGCGSHPSHRAASTRTGNSIQTATVHGSDTPIGHSSQAETPQQRGLELQHFHLNHADVPGPSSQPSSGPPGGLPSPPLTDEPSSQPSSPIAIYPTQYNTEETNPRFQRGSRSLPPMLDTYLLDAQAHEELATGTMTPGRREQYQQRTLRTIELEELSLRLGGGIGSG